MAWFARVKPAASLADMPNRESANTPPASQSPHHPGTDGKEIKKQTKALVLFSGGLDSRLVVKLLQEQNIIPICVMFKLPFGGGCCNNSSRVKASKDPNCCGARNILVGRRWWFAREFVGGTFCHAAFSCILVSNNNNTNKKNLLENRLVVVALVLSSFIVFL